MRVGEGINFEGGRGYQFRGWERVSISRVGEGINFGISLESLIHNSVFCRLTGNCFFQWSVVL